VPNRLVMQLCERDRQYRPLGDRSWCAPTS
jgi:hypothetical protein